MDYYSRRIINRVNTVFKNTPTIELSYSSNCVVMVNVLKLFIRRLSMAKVQWPLTFVTGNPNKLREALQILGKDYENKVS